MEDFKAKVNIAFEKTLANHIEAISHEYTRDSERVDHRAMNALLAKALESVARVRKYLEKPRINS